MRARVLFAVFVLLGSLAAQLDTGSIVRRVRVRVIFANGGCDLRTHVRLMGRYGVMAESSVDDQCLVTFTNIPVGTYHFAVSGETFKNTDSGEIAMNTAATPEYDVTVRRTGEPEQAGDSLVFNGFVSAADLAIPRRAQKEFSAGSDLLARQDLAHAVQKFNKAIEIYPSYAGAYNSLGVIYARLGDAGRSREALQKAIQTNDHFAMAYMNLGLLELSAANFPAAENALLKADSFDPASATTLAALSYAQFMQTRRCAGHEPESAYPARRPRIRASSGGARLQAEARCGMRDRRAWNVPEGTAGGNRSGESAQRVV